MKVGRLASGVSREAQWNMSHRRCAPIRAANDVCAPGHATDGRWQWANDDDRFDRWPCG